MRRIDTDLERLQPVAIDHPLEGESVRRRRDEAVEVRERWRRAGAEIGEQDAASFDHRIGFLPDIGAQIAVVGLGGRLQALAVHVEQPAVKRATQSAILQPPIGEIGAAMRAVPADQPVAPLVVLESDKVLAEKPNRLYRPVAGKLIDQRRRLPVAPQQIAGGGSRSGAGHAIVLLDAQHRRHPHRASGGALRCFIRWPPIDRKMRPVRDLSGQRAEPEALSETSRRASGRVDGAAGSR